MYVRAAPCHRVILSLSKDGRATTPLHESWIDSRTREKSVSYSFQTADPTAEIIPKGIIMNKAIITGLSIVTLAAAMLPIAASAGEVSNRINDEQARINAAVNNRQIGPRTAGHLQDVLNGIRAQRDRDMARHGGRLTRFDVQNLNAREANLSSQISFDLRFHR